MLLGLPSCHSESGVDPTEAADAQRQKYVPSGPSQKKLADLALECIANALAKKEDNLFSILQKIEELFRNLESQSNRRAR